MNLVGLDILYMDLKTCSNKVPTTNKVFRALKLFDLENFRALKASNLVNILYGLKILQYREL